MLEVVASWLPLKAALAGCESFDDYLILTGHHNNNYKNLRLGESDPDPEA